MSSHHVLRPTTSDILRFRYHNGVNLGGLFVLEQWLSPSMFDHGVSGSSELDAVVASVNIRGIEQTRAKWERYWEDGLSDADLKFLTTVANITTIRLPIGYFTLVYKNAWTAVKSTVQLCYGYGLGVILDMHALPGGANTEIHSGTSRGEAELWTDPFNLDIAYRCFQFIAQQVTSDQALAGVIGLQLVNEASFDAPHIFDFYDHATMDITRINSGIPIYISDGWDLQRTMNWAKDKNNVARNIPSNPIIVDTHKYYAFSEKDIKRSPQALIAQVSMELNEALDDALLGTVFDNKGAIAIFIGEYSCAISHLSWERAEKSKRKSLLKQFGLEQGKRWRERSCGAAFWTFKMEGDDRPDWSLRRQVEAGAIFSPPEYHLKKDQIVAKLRAADQQHSKLMLDAMQAHTAYWDNQAPGLSFEHWRYADGWHLGWVDARDFYRARSEGLLGDGEKGADKIGMVDLWVLKRMKEERVAIKEECEFGWEWEIGFRKGLSDFEKSVGLC